MIKKIVCFIFGHKRPRHLEKDTGIFFHQNKILKKHWIVYRCVRCNCIIEEDK